MLTDAHGKKLDHIIALLEGLTAMTAGDFTSLNAAVAALQAEDGALATAVGNVQANVTALTDALAAGDTAAANAAAALIQTEVGNITNAVATLQADAPPASSSSSSG